MDSMRKTLALLGTVAVLAAVFASVSAAAGHPTLTVRAANQTESYVDANRNGVFDPGDSMLIAAPLYSLDGTPVGQFQALLTPIAASTGRVNAVFVFPGYGMLFVGGTVNFESGPPKGLRVTSAVGGLRALKDATLTITDQSDDSSLFTFGR
jgi:hypothetical protein